MVATYTRDMLFKSTNWAKRTGSATLDLPVATFNIFTVTGFVLVTYAFGYVTTIIAGAATPRIQFTPTVGVQTPLCAAAASIDTDAVGTLYLWDGLAASQLIPSAVLGAGGLIATSRWTTPGIILAPGTIQVTNGGALATGVIDWYASWVPISSGASLAST